LEAADAVVQAEELLDGVSSADGANAAAVDPQALKVIIITALYRI
jgi:hypothetical protein